jgi:ATP-binding cassette subfamily B protein
MDEIVTAARAAGADGFIEELPEGYETVVGERGFTLSGGQRQRIAIARTLIVNPRILVLDDATSAIDVQIEQQIHEALSDLMTGRTTLIVAHRLSTISLADRVAVVEDGRVIAQGTHAELLATEPRYSAILAHAVVDDEDDEPVGHDPLARPVIAEVISREIDADVAGVRVLDTDIAELKDLDEAPPRGGTV